MPDDNKFQKLREIGYQIPITCKLCIYGDFRPSATWGTCKVHHYDHKKHDNPEAGRGISIHASGQCSDADARVDKLAAELGAHIEFVPKHA